MLSAPAPARNNQKVIVLLGRRLRERNNHCAQRSMTAKRNFSVSKDNVYSKCLVWWLLWTGFTYRDCRRYNLNSLQAKGVFSNIQMLKNWCLNTHTCKKRDGVIEFVTHTLDERHDINAVAARWPALFLEISKEVKLKLDWEKTTIWCGHTVRMKRLYPKLKQPYDSSISCKIFWYDRVKSVKIIDSNPGYCQTNLENGVFGLFSGRCQ